MIDFQAVYAQWLREQIKVRALENQQDIEDIDEMAAELYDVWLNTPQEAFDGKAPSHYFDGYGANALVGDLLAYSKKNRLAPDPLCDAITDCQDCVPLLIEALDTKLTESQNQAVLERLSEMQAEQMLGPCMRLILGQNDIKADQAAQAILLFGQPAAKLAFEYLKEEGHTDRVTDRLADIVASCGPCEGGYDILCLLFEKRGEARAYYAQCLAKIGDERAVPMLMLAAGQPQLAYYDYVAIRDAIEELGGELDQEREFFGDRDYMISKDDDD